VFVNVCVGRRGALSNPILCRALGDHMLGTILYRKVGKLILDLSVCPRLFSDYVAAYERSASMRTLEQFQKHGVYNLVIFFGGGGGGIWDLKELRV